MTDLLSKRTLNLESNSLIDLGYHNFLFIFSFFRLFYLPLSHPARLSTLFTTEIFTFSLLPCRELVSVLDSSIEDYFVLEIKSDSFNKGVRAQKGARGERSTEIYVCIELRADYRRPRINALPGPHDNYFCVSHNYCRDGN